MEHGGKWGIDVKEIPVGRDIMLIVTGGAAHIGSVATAFFSDHAKGVEVQTVDIPGHREGELASEMAAKAAAALRRTVTVAAGIHYDGMNREQIVEIVSEAMAVFEKYLGKKTAASERKIFCEF